MAQRQQGKVVRLVADRGFGFIRATEGTELFFHRSACDDWPAYREGAAVTFVPGQGAKGPRAEDVALVE